ncbi:uncharacterized protein KY384_003415 [Bacidia gigantensis]|uniref:uncharacterized protein n=1 Tax=Bacidia gigantensis TaxID=2732470 RepID=UPI001D0395B8|nr:uncharacterized protein KY384_003415 [Bacidia gigantensis]KAG8531779.1 hypothetical protein KY384_003415 [Bacidia gigantensis]
MAILQKTLSYARQKQLFHPNFYRVHLSYFILVILLSSVIVYGSGVDGNSHDEEARFRLRYIDALFLCTSAMTNTGLNTVNLSSLTAFQQSVLFILMLMGNMIVVSVATVPIRRYFMQKHMQQFVEQSETGRKIVDDINQDEYNGESRYTGKNKGYQPMSRGKASAQQSSSSGPRRRPNAKSSKPDTQYPAADFYHHHYGQGGFPSPWNWRVTQSLKSKLSGLSHPGKHSHHYLSFQPSLDHKVRTDIHFRRAALGGNLIFCFRAGSTHLTNMNVKNLGAWNIER